MRIFGAGEPEASNRSGPLKHRSRGDMRMLWLLGRYVWALPNTLVGVLFVPCALLPGGGTRLVDGVLEVHGPSISSILRHAVPVQGGAAAMTFGHIVLGRDRLSLDTSRRHERVHVRQCEIWGPAFIPAYLIAALWALIRGTGAYAGNYFERQAAFEETLGSVERCHVHDSAEPIRARRS